MPLVSGFDVPAIVHKEEKDKPFIYVFTVDQNYLKPTAKSTDRVICKIGLAQEAHTLHRLDNYLTSFPDTPSFLAFIYCRADLSDKTRSPAARLERAIHDRLRPYELRLKRYGRTRGGLEWFDVPITVLKDALIYEYWKFNHKFGPHKSSSGNREHVSDARKLVFWAINDREIEHEVDGKKQRFLVRPIEQIGAYREQKADAPPVVKPTVWRMTRTRDDDDRDKEILYTRLDTIDPLSILLLKKYMPKMTIQDRLDAEEIE